MHCLSPVLHPDIHFTMVFPSGCFLHFILSLPQCTNLVVLLYTKGMHSSECGSSNHLTADFSGWSLGLFTKGPSIGNDADCQSSSSSGSSWVLWLMSLWPVNLKAWKTRWCSLSHNAFHVTCMQHLQCRPLEVALQLYFSFWTLTKNKLFHCKYMMQLHQNIFHVTWHGMNMLESIVAVSTMNQYPCALHSLLSSTCQLLCHDIRLHSMATLTIKPCKALKANLFHSTGRWCVGDFICTSMHGI